MSKNHSFFDEYDSFYPVTGSGIGTSTTGSKVQYVSCYTTHPVLKIGKGTVIGGSCSSPTVDNANIYIGLDAFMKRKKNHYPWEKETKDGPVEVLFKIDDGFAPSDEKNFIVMVDWLAARLEEGKTIHIGCMGGHGRTGIVLAALVKVVLGEEDAITWVRTNYCKKAVETRVQVVFLMTYFGIKEVEGAKEADLFNPGKKKGKKGAQSGTRKFHQDKHQRSLLTNDDFIPGTSIPRSKGPRDLQKVTTSVINTLIRAQYLRNGNPHSIWISGLTNAKKSVRV